jgi:hypothetical protein
MPYPLGYFASEGGFTAGPLLFPGSPGTLDESCWRTARLWSLMSEPVVSPEGFTAGPLLLPGLPGIPAPEFCPLGTVVWPPPDGAVVCAEAGSAPRRRHEALPGGCRASSTSECPRAPAAEPGTPGPTINRSGTHHDQWQTTVYDYGVKCSRSAKMPNWRRNSPKQNWKTDRIFRHCTR